MGNPENQIIWQRTVIGAEALRYDFSATLDGRTVGRIRRHWDEHQWMWSAYLTDGTGRHGVLRTKQEAVDMIHALAAR